MSRERRQLRGVVLAEDKRTERFFRELLKKLGFAPTRFRFETAPKGKGAGDAWVQQRYPKEVQALRSNNYQRGLRLITILDGDHWGHEGRKQQLDSVLRALNLQKRQTLEKIAIPVPTRNIETWLLALLGEEGLDEATDYKDRFQQEQGPQEREALRDAANSWQALTSDEVPSLIDGQMEMARVEP